MRPHQIRACILCAMCAGVMHFAAPALAQSPNGAGRSGAAPAVAAERPPMPGVPKMTLLVQTYMSALAQAVATGNYSVLLALSAPEFQKLNPPDKLAQTFAGFREHKIDILPIVLYQPILVDQPAMDVAGRLRLKGYYATEPQNVNFELALQSVGGIWMLMEISAGVQPARHMTKAQQTTPAAPDKAKAAEAPETPKASKERAGDKGKKRQ